MKHNLSSKVSPSLQPDRETTQKVTLTILAFVFLASIEAITSGRIAAQGKEQLALRIDFVSRIIFPLAFLGVILRFWKIL